MKWEGELDRIVGADDEDEDLRAVVRVLREWIPDGDMRDALGRLIDEARREYDGGKETMQSLDDRLLQRVRALDRRSIVTVDICWWRDDGHEKRVTKVELEQLPRRGDVVNLEGLDEKRFGLEDDEDLGGGVDWLVVLQVVHRTGPCVIASLVHCETGVGLTEVWVAPPGSAVCGHCNRVVGSVDEPG